MHRDWYNKGNMYFDNGDFHAAINAYTQALNYYPNHLNSKMNLGLCYCETGELMTGEKWLRECLLINPNEEKALHNLGRCLEKQGRLEEGQTFFKQAVEVNPYYKSARIGLGSNYFKLQLFDQAEKEYLKLIEYGYEALAYYCLAVEFFESKNILRAQYYRDKYFEIKPEKRGLTLNDIP